MEIDFYLMTNAESDVSNHTCRCIEYARRALAQKNINFVWELAAGFGWNKSKCVCMSTFLLKTDIPYLISIDRDIIFPPEYLEKLYNNLKSGYDLIAGIYCKRSGKGLSGTFGYGKKTYYLDGKIQEFQYIPWGFTGVSRRLLQKMVDEIPLSQLGKSDIKYYPFCEYVVADEEDELTGDDTSFCEKAHKVGAKAYVDTSIQVGHLGDYIYNIQDFLNYQDGKTGERQRHSNLMKDLAEYFNISIEEVSDKLNAAIPQENADWENRKGSVEDFYKGNTNYIFGSAYWNLQSDRYEKGVVPLRRITESKMLDIGCGIGTTCFTLENLANEVTGYDINEEQIKFANYRKERHNFKSEFTTVMPDLSKFDVVICIDTLEHIEDLKTFIEMLGAGMKTGARFYHHDDFVPAPSHFARPDEMNSWFEGAGFRILDNFWATKL